MYKMSGTTLMGVCAGHANRSYIRVMEHHSSFQLKAQPAWDVDALSCRLRRRKSLAQEMEFQGLRRSVAGIYLLRTLIKWNQYAWLWGIVGDNCHAGASSAVCCTGYLLRLGTSLDMPCKHESKYATKYCKYRLVLKSMKSGILHEATCTLDSSVEVLQRCFGGYTRIKEISVSDMLCCGHCVNRYLNPTCYTLNCDGKGMCGLTYNSCCDTRLGP